MQKYLFRGKRVDNGEWVEGFGIIQYNNGNAVIIDKRHERAYLIDPATVGQWTGLVDKNGNRVFDGDIVRNEHFRERNKQHYLYHRIEYNEQYMQFAAISSDNENNSMNVAGNCFLWVYAKKEFEKIGNIHDNPELLPNA